MNTYIIVSDCGVIVYVVTLAPYSGDTFYSFNSPEKSIWIHVPALKQIT